MVASLFRGVPNERFGEVREMFLRIRDEFGVPLEVVNDGDVTALAGSMSLEDNGVLGIALGSSEAAGYVNPEGDITGWLNELAFAPVDYQPGGGRPTSGRATAGVGALYFSQQCVFRLAPARGIDAARRRDARPSKLKLVQALLEAGHEGARKIWETMGVYLGYGIAHYADFYELRARADPRPLHLGPRRPAHPGRRQARARSRSSPSSRRASTSSCRTRRAGASASRSPPPACRPS